MVDIRDYSSIYHLHIPRTSGVFMRGHLLREFQGKQNFSTHYKSIDSNYIKNCYFVTGHFGLYPIEFMNNPFVFTTLRNPVDRFVSYFRYVHPLISKEDPNLAFDRWINDESIYVHHSNTQTKFLSNSIDIDRYNSSIKLDTRFVENWLIGKDENINNAKHFLDNNTFFIMEDNNIYTELHTTLGIKDFPHRSKVNGALDIGLEISKKQYARIEELNSLDLELYEYARSKKER
jgi:hypothetical protein